MEIQDAECGLEMAITMTFTPCYYQHTVAVARMPYGLSGFGLMVYFLGVVGGD